MLSKVVKASLIFLLSCSGVAEAAASKVVVCASAKGDLTARTKCRKGESVFSAALLAQNLVQTVGATVVGPTGAVGAKGLPGTGGAKGVKGKIDFSGCRIVSGYATNFSSPSSNALSVNLACNPGAEFLFDEDYRATDFPASAGTVAFVQMRSGTQINIAGDTRDYEVTYYFNRERSGGSGQFAGAYQVTARGICCPR